MGSQNGQAVCLSRGSKEKEPRGDTMTPFGRAYYKGEADYFVIPYIGILLVGLLTATLSAVYWAISAVTVAQILRQLQIHFVDLGLFEDTWYRFGLLYGLIALCFICVLNLQCILTMAWVILTKWLVIGRRKEGTFLWDKSSYCEFLFGVLSAHALTKSSRRPTMAVALDSVKTTQQGIRSLGRPRYTYRNRLYRLVLPSFRRKGRKELLAWC